MIYFFVLLIFIFSALLFIGMINPNIGLFWYKGTRTRLKAALIYAFCVFIFIFFAGLSMSPEQKAWIDAEALARAKREDSIKDALKVKNQQEKIIQEQEKATLAAIKAAKNRKPIVLRVLNEWDGANEPLKQYVKDNMNDPESFKHVETLYRMMYDSTVYIEMKYRGKNAFGGVVTERISAIVDSTNKLLQVTPLN